jgi:hypothetical protein
MGIATSTTIDIAYATSFLFPLTAPPAAIAAETPQMDTAEDSTAAKDLFNQSFRDI